MTLLLIEGMIGGPSQGQPSAFSDLNMMVATGGRERRLDEWQSILERAGFSLARSIETASRFRILEAHL